jgi:hypothetical protein
MNKIIVFSKQKKRISRNIPTEALKQTPDEPGFHMDDNAEKGSMIHIGIVPNREEKIWKFIMTH